MTLWSAENTDRLLQLARDGLTAAAIAAKLSTEDNVLTRNAVIGRLHRLSKGSERGPAMISVRLKRKARDRWAGHVPKPRKAKPPLPKAEPVLLIDPPEFRCVPLLGLEPYHCRWPSAEGPITFCGEQRTPGSSYCAYHQRLSRRVVE